MYETKLTVAAEEWENYETIMRAEISRKVSNEKNDRHLFMWSGLNSLYGFPNLGF